MTSYLIIGIAVAIYLLFRLWYYGLGRKASPELIEHTLQAMQEGGIDTQRCEYVRTLLEKDDGKDLVMVNLLNLKQPIAESRAKLQQYSKTFLGGALKRATHPVLLSTAATGNVESLNTSDSDEWRSVFIVRYRSRTDMAKILVETFDSPHHNLKLEALEKTIGFPATVSGMAGGIKKLVPLVIALFAALLHIILV